MKTEKKENHVAYTLGKAFTIRDKGHKICLTIPTAPERHKRATVDSVRTMRTIRNILNTSNIDAIKAEKIIKGIG